MIDVPLEHAVLVWDETVAGGTAVFVDNRKPIDKFEHLINSAGACGPDDWRSMSDAERLSSLLLSGWGAILRDGVSPEMIHGALSTVPEYRKWAVRELRGTRHWDDLPEDEE